MKKTLLSLSLVAVIAAFSSCGCDAGTENNSDADAATVAEAATVAADETNDAAKCGEGKCGDGKEKEVKKSKFEMMDADSDGNVTESEFVTFVSTKFSKKDADGNGKLTEDECAHFETVNVDGDDIVTEEEFTNGVPSVFAEIDTDGDGNITAAEFKASMKPAPEAEAESK